MRRILKGFFALVIANTITTQSSAWAAGFTIREQSGSALGSAFSGATAGAEDISHMFFNPAGLTRQSGNQILATLSYVSARAQFDPTTASTVLGTPIAGGGGGSDIADDVVVPAVYALWEIAPDLKAGLGLTAPFGLSTDYEEGWIGRYHALESELQTINLNPAIAYRVTDFLSLGAGLQVSYARARLTNAIDFGLLDAATSGAAFGGIPGANDGHGKVEGEDWAVGFNLGILLELDDSTRFGAAYRSETRHELEGEADFELGGPVGAGISGATGRFLDSGASADLALPETLSFGFYHELTPAWSVMGEAAWTNWSRVDELRVRFDNPLQPDSITPLDWQDSWFFALGTSYRATDRLTLRMGLAHDRSPVPDRTRTPRIPDDDRTWVSVGLSYQPIDQLWLDLGFTHIFVDGADLDLSTAEPANVFRGSLSGEVDSSIDILAVQLHYQF